MSKFLSRIKAIPPRAADWANRNGPVAIWGCDNLGNGSADRLHKVFQETGLTTDNDYYSRVKWYEEGPIEAHPASVPHLPVLNLGVMDQKQEEGNFLENAATVAGSILERGYVPITLGGDPNITAPIFEGIKTVHRDDIVMVVFGADGRLSTRAGGAEGPPAIRSLLDKKLLRGLLHLGGRRIGKEERKLRQKHNVKYIDCNALYSKGINNMKDFQNTYPLYISIDLSALDPVAAPGVLEPEPGGLSVRELLHVLGTLRGTKVVGMDIVGYRPEHENILGKQLFGITELSASKVIKESVGKAYHTSTMTAAEAQEKVVKMKKDGLLHPDYPEF